MRVGIDVGGTFTDVVLIDDESGKIYYTKTLTTPSNPAQGVLNGIEKILGIAGATMADLDYMVHGHGTTIGTNALIERKGARTGLITTEGFRDVLEIARIERPDEGLYDFNVDTPEPLVPRYLRLGVKERIGSKGEVVTPLDEEDARRAVRYLKSQGVQTIAVCTLFSFLNPSHEQRIKAICQEEFPEAFVSLSSEVAPEFREFERTSTTVLNAYLQPIVQRYIETLDRMLREQYGPVEVRIMQASGGAITAEMAKYKAVNTVNSGPAGGAVASCFMGRLTGDLKLITVDMGGTSFDIGLVEDGQPRVTSDGSFEGYPVKIPALDVHAIGAGGGSIAWIDRGGALNVGPQSAAADPGPACYGLGGEQPVVTDANLVLGRLNPDYFLGGEMRLYPEKAREAVRKHIAEPLGLSVEEAAYGIIRVVNANMVKGISSSSIEKGYDPREFTMVAFGGAGPVHAVELADDLGINRVVIPLYPGALSAFGLVTSDIRHDYVQTIARGEDAVRPEDFQAAYAIMEQEARRDLAAQRVSEEEMALIWTADVRYAGQSYELNVPFPRKKVLTGHDIHEVVAAFHTLHQRIYEYSSRTEKTEFINVRLTAIGRVPPVRLPERPLAGPDPREALKGHRPVYFGRRGFVECPVYERDALQPGNLIEGPCIVEEIISSTVVTPGWRGTVDGYGNVILSKS